MVITSLFMKYLAKSKVIIKIKLNELLHGTRRLFNDNHLQ